MQNIPPNVLASAADPSMPKEGLPYWILYFLISIILLLVVFIFLRDKEMRRRLSFSLYGPRRRWGKMRTQMRISREERKRAELLRELGRKAWSIKLTITEAVSLVQKIDEYQREMARAQEHVERISAALESIRGGGPKALSTEAMKEVRALENSLKTALEAMSHIERHQEPLFEAMGTAVKSEHPSQPAFLPLYAQIDLCDETIQNLKRHLDSLRRT